MSLCPPRRACPTLNRKAVNSVGPPQDPELLFLLMTQYVNGNRQGEGVEFFSARLKEFEGCLAQINPAK